MTMALMSGRGALMLLAVLGLLNLALDLRLARGLKALAATRDRPPEHYSMVGEDYPARLPLPRARRAVRLLTEDSARYALATPEAHKEWIYMSTVGDNNAHLGGRQRYFSLAITHEIHCLNALRDALADVDPPEGRSAGHLAHCLSYLRQATLCRADTTLEGAEVMEDGNRGPQGGAEHVCVDWDAFYEEMKQNWLSWGRWKKLWRAGKAQPEL
ncbi:hypothetical protein BV25DRAFT_1841935 [Artomyces pyxidatus]|uniref:Uncharacterized protein n=1 Tax=Artomyces pyxidatus TaxID=48021 RepID=A0ACB8SMI4_9AGAM|nr:hypothetical protein BV25DRAFT_1841935 [Artomyces pyxidatus]